MCLLGVTVTDERRQRCQILQKDCSEVLSRLDSNTDVHNRGIADKIQILQQTTEDIQRLQQTWHSKWEKMYTKNITTILSSLWFQEMHYGFNEIEHAHEGTLEWVFDEQRRGQRFAAWLANGGNMFCFEGKAGCGKSVLMRFIYSSRQLNCLIERAAQSKPIVKASFFACSYGNSPLQRSISGLMRSLLYQILENDGVARQVEELKKDITGKPNLFLFLLFCSSPYLCAGQCIALTHHEY